jgi:tripartite ATP-independent transporter DctM subunit
MIDLSPLAVLVIMFGSLIVLLLSGLPVVFAMGSISVILIFLLWGPAVGSTILVANAFGVTTSYILIAVPMFVFMAMIMRSSGIAEDLFHSLRLWLDRIPGGLAMAVVVVSVFIAAMSGIMATGVLILGIIAVPLMFKYGYSKEIAIGPVLAGGALGELIPPSTLFILYGALATVSVGQLFMGGIIPGLILAGLYITYIGIRCYLRPELGPPVPPEERVGWREKFASLKGLLLPIALIAAVLGSIFMGVASASEASGIGAIGAIVCAAIRRKLSWQAVKEACISTLSTTAMVIWVMIGAFAFKGVFVLSGGPTFVTEWVASLDIPPLAIIGIMQVAFMILGCFTMETVILMICIPVFLPIVDALGLDRLWFGVLFLTNVQMAFLTPPFGFGLYFMKGVASKDISMADIIRSVIPFLPLQAIGVLLVLFFPRLALWLPAQMLG